MTKHDINNILSKGVELIRLNGYHNTGIRDILKTCNIPKGSFYHLFESKEDFIIKSIEYYDREVNKEFKVNLSDKSLSYFDRIKNHFKLNIIWYTNNEYRAGCFLGNLSVEVAGINDPIAKKLNHVYAKWSNGLASFIEAGQNKGEIIKTIPSKQIASFLLDGFNGAIARMKVERTTEALEQFLELNFSFIKAS